MECASLFTKKNESSSHCVSFKFKHFLSSPQSSLELSCFYFFSFLNVHLNLKINVHNTKQGPYLQNNCTSGCNFCTVRHYNCWRWESGRKFLSIVYFFIHKWKIQILLRAVSVNMLVSALKNYGVSFGETSHVWPPECVNPLISSIYTHFLQTGINTKHTAVTQANFVLIGLIWVDLWFLSALWGLQFTRGYFFMLNSLWKGYWEDVTAMR